MTHYLDFGGLAYFLQKLRETFTSSEWLNVNAEFDRFVITKDVVTDFTQTDEEISVVFNSYDKHFIAFVPTGDGFYASRWNGCENYGDLDTTGVTPRKKMIYRCLEDNNLYTWNGHNLVAVTATSSDKYLRRDINDTARGIITFTVGTKWGSFSTESGAAMSIDRKGRSYLELDRLKVRLKAYFETLEIQQVTYVGGKLVITPGRGFVAQIVEETETAYRCYYLAEQDGKEVKQTIAVDDFLMYKEFNIGPGVYEHVENRYYWRHVDTISTEPISIEGKKYHWVDVSKTDCDDYSDVPEVGDNLCQVGNRTQTDRQGAIIISTLDLNSPSISMYSDINDYTFANRDFVEFGIFSGKPYTNIYGSAYIGDRKLDGKTPKGYIEWDNEAKTLRIKGSISFNSTFGDDSDRTIEDIFKAIEDSMTDSYEYLEGYINDNMELIQSQVDKSITTWFYDDLPYPHISSNPDDQSTTSEPASDWITDADKALHEGDLYYAKAHDRAFAWRNKSEYGYIWEEIYDANALKALRDAADAADLADHKRRVFVDTPIPPYDEGDMWANATYPKTEDLKEGEEYRFFNDLARCITPKTAEEEFSIDDWDLASKYTDDAMTLELGKDVQGALNAITNTNKSLDDIKNFADEAFRDNYVNASEANRLLSMVNNLKLSRLALENQKDAVLDDPMFQRFVDLSIENEVIKNNLITTWEAYDSKVTELIGLIETIAANAKSSYGMKLTAEQRGEFDRVFGEVSSCQDELVKAIKQCEFGISQLLDSKVTQLANELGGYNYLREALAGTTYIEGGLILTTVIALGKRGLVNGEHTFDVKSGISGLITSEPNEGAAFWAGGDRISIFDCDYDADNDVYYIGDTVVDPADAMIHHDGTAYFSKGSVRFLGDDEVFLGDWNKKTNYLHWKDGTLNIKGTIDLSSPTTYNGYTFSKLFKDINATLQDQKAAIEETLPNLIDKVNKDLQSQIDGAIETYFYEGEPNVGNKPWKDWIDSGESLATHIGDLYYDKLTGFAYRFQTDSTVQEGYSWQRLKDSEIEKALSAAEAAQETADGKMKVFYSQPTAPYQIGDLWVNAVFEGTDLSGNPVLYNNDLLRCNHTNTDHFQIDDWCLASKYNYDEPIRQLGENITGVFNDLKKTNTLVDNIKNFTNEAFYDNYLSNTEKNILSEYRGQVTAAYYELLARITKVQEDVAAYKGNTAIDESVRQNIEERVGTPSNRTGTFITKYNNLITALDEVLKISGDMSAFETKKEIYSQALEAYNDEVKQLSSILFSLEHALYSAYLSSSEKKLYEEVGNYKYLSEALGPYGGTILDKGLVMSQFLAMGMFRNNGDEQEFREWSGVSGVYIPNTSTSDVTKTEEHGGIAFWAGGEPYSIDLLKRQDDYEKFVYEQVEWNGIPEYVYNLWDDQHTMIVRTLRPAKFLIYQDGTGYAAGGKIRFNEDGTITAESDSFYVSVDKTNYQVGLTAAMFRYVLQDKTATTITWGNVLSADLKKPLNGIDLFAKSYTVDHNVGGGSIQTETYYSAIRFWNSPTSYNAVNAAPQSSIYYDPDQHAIHVQANLVVTGGITMYSTTGEISSGIMDSIIVDGQTIGIVNGALAVLSVPGLSVSDLKTLTITSGSSNLGTYTPTGSDVTIDITPSKIGAAASTHTHSAADITDLDAADFASKSHVHSVKINGSLKVIAAPGGEAVDLGTYLVSSDLSQYVNELSKDESTNVFVTSISKSGKVLSYTKSFTKKSLSSKGSSGWTSAAVDSLIIPDMSFIAYWNGAYDSKGSSNLTYCAKGEFGSMAIKDADNYSTTTEINTKLTDGSVTKLGTTTVGSSTKPIYWNEGRPNEVGTSIEVDITGNSATTTKLKNKISLWGQQFDGSSDISGSMTEVEDLTMSGVLSVNGVSIEKTSSGVLRIDGDIVVTGGITMYASDGVKSGMIDQVYAVLDQSLFSKSDDGTYITITGEIGSGTVKAVKVGSTQYDPDPNGIIALPEYPTATTAEWDNILNKPSLFPPSAHIHAISEITNLQATLDGKAAASHTHSYLPLAGGTMTGALNFKNATWNLMGDDAYIGDCNIAGMIGVKAASAVAPGFVLYDNSGTLLGKLYASGSTLNWSGGTIAATTFSGNASTASLLALNTSPASTVATAVGSWMPVSNKVWVYRQRWTNSAAGNDTADLSIYLDGNLTANMCLDGYYFSLLGFQKSGSSDSYVLLGGGGHKAESSLSVNYASSAGNADTIDGYHVSSLYKEKTIYSHQSSIYDLRFNYGMYNKGDVGGTYQGEYPTGWGAYLSLAFKDKNCGALMFFDTPLSNALGHIYVRTRGAGDGNTTYTGWGTLAYLTDNVASASYASSAGNADTLDGNHASAFATAGHIHFSRTDPLNIDNIATNTPWHYEVYNGSGTLPFSSAWHHIYNMGSGDANYGVQLATGYTDNTSLYLRHKIAGTWHAWRNILDSGNYNDYVPTKTGSGASGTWGISITGNAATATALTSSAGSSTTPVYFSGGKPVACGYGLTNFLWANRDNDFNPASMDGDYVGMTTFSGITGDWWHIISLNWCKGHTAGDKTWASQLALPTQTLRGIRYRTGAYSGAYNSWVLCADMERTNEGNFSVSGGITMYSDLRKKNILSDEVLSVKEIAAAPLFRHTYKSDDNQYIHVGTSAQYWNGIHEDWFTRKDSEGYYQMELQNLGVAMGISLAREIVTFEGAFKRYESKTDKKIRLMRKKINDLEARIKELEGSMEERRTA